MPYTTHSDLDVLAQLKVANLSNNVEQKNSDVNKKGLGDFLKEAGWTKDKTR